MLQATAAQYTPVSLVGDSAATITTSIRNPATFVDTNLVNPWGLAASPTGPFWVANNGTGTATLYNGEGQAQSLVVTIPSPGGSTEAAAPTGTVFNGGSGFTVTANGQTAPAAFLFATEDGTISGWNPTVSPTAAVQVVDNSANGAIYKGLTIATLNGAQRLYATDFHNGRVDVFDAGFNPVTTTGGFVDRRIPRGYAPFGIANINGQIYVSYARQDALREDDVPGRGRGFVDIYTPDGVLVRRLVRQGQLNAPWGMTLAPADFGRFSNDLLVGNFGNGTINAYNPTSGRFIGTLRDATNRQIRIDGLWALEFGNGGNAGATNSLFFTAGPGQETHGLFGRINAVNPTSTPTPPVVNPVQTTGVNPGQINGPLTETNTGFTDITPVGNPGILTTPGGTLTGGPAGGTLTGGSTGGTLTGSPTGGTLTGGPTGGTLGGSPTGGTLTGSSTGGTLTSSLTGGTLGGVTTMGTLGGGPTGDTLVAGTGGSLLVG